MRWLLGVALVCALAPTVARAQVIEVCDGPWLHPTRLAEALRIEVGETDANVIIDDCGSEGARVAILRQGRFLGREVPWGDTPGALRVRLVAIVVAELLHTDEAMRELARADAQRSVTRGSVTAAGRGDVEGAADVSAEREREAASSAEPIAEPSPRLMVDVQLGARIFPPLPVRYTDDEFVTMDAAFGVQWRRLLARTSILARGGGDEDGRVKFRAYLGVLGARLLDGVDGAWRLQLDVLATLGIMQARGHLDPNPTEADGVQLRPAAGLALAMGVVHGRERTRVGFRLEFGYLQGMAVNQGGHRVGTLTGWNVAFLLSVGFRVDET